jgi:hypothetical protein
MWDRVVTLSATSQLKLQLEGWAILAVALILLIVVPVLAVRKMRRGRQASQWETLQERARERVADDQLAGPPVSFTFYTYSGFLVVATQTKHEPELAAPLALEYLWELHKYNLWNSLVPYHGSLYVPLLSWLNYRTQRRRIQEQAERGNIGAGPRGRTDL